MKTSILTSFIVVLTFSYLSFSQVTQEWVKDYSNPGNYGSVGQALVIDAGGNVYVTCSSAPSASNYDYVTIKYNSQGVQQWVATYDGSAHSSDIPRSIALDRENNVYVTGESIGSGSGYDCVTIKYNQSGVQQWIQRYNGTADTTDCANSIKIDGQDNVYIAGYCTDLVSSFDCLTIKYSSDGIQQWVRTYNGSGNADDAANAMVLDAQGNIYVTGFSNSISTYRDYTTIKYSPSGVQQWVAIYNGPANYLDYATAIAVDAQSNVFVTGKSGSDQVYTNIVTIKYNSSGVQQWVQRYIGPINGLDEGRSIAVDDRGNVFIAGIYETVMTGKDFITIKYNLSGVQQWVSFYDGPWHSHDLGKSLSLDKKGNVYVTGNSVGGTSTLYDYATVKYDSMGTQVWVVRYNGPGNFFDEPYVNAVDTQDNVYVTGFTAGIDTVDQCTTIKYSQPVGIKTLNKNIPDKFLLYQNYPNPFNPTTKIKFDIPNMTPPLIQGGQGRLVTLKIFDILGREVSTLVNEKLSPGTYEVEWNASGYSTGVYFYRLISDGKNIDTRKMVIIK